MELLPLGSIIKVNNYKLCIIGYASSDNESSSEYGYFVVSYPFGFTNIEKTIFIPHSMEFELIAEGYKTDESETVLKMLYNGLEALRDIPQEKTAVFNDAYKKINASKEVMQD